MAVGATVVLSSQHQTGRRRFRCVQKRSNHQAGLAPGSVSWVWFDGGGGVLCVWRCTSRYFPVVSTLSSARGSAVGGEATYDVRFVCAVSGADFAASAPIQVGPGVTGVHGRGRQRRQSCGPIRCGVAEIGGVELAFESRTKLSTTTWRAAGDESAASSLEMTVRPANFFGVTRTSRQ
jgi:hypothetical protein